MNLAHNAVMRPIIGITCDHNLLKLDDGSVEYTQYLLPHYYSIAVEHAGGVPVLLPYRSDSSLVGRYVDLCDGFVLSGGNDYDPAAWGQVRHPNAIPIDPQRERFDRAVIAEIERRDRPVLGICGGCQLMNIHRGGSLHQFIPDLGLSPVIKHSRNTLQEWSRRHDVEVDASTLLARVLGSTKATSNSSHKQSVDRVGAGLSITAHSPDGIVEAIEDPRRKFYLGVQWHPERQHAEPDQSRLFTALIDAASR